MVGFSWWTHFPFMRWLYSLEVSSGDSGRDSALQIDVRIIRRRGISRFSGFMR